MKEETLKKARDEQFEAFREKIGKMKEMSHRNIIRMLGSQELPEPLIVLERTERGGFV